MRNPCAQQALATAGCRQLSVFRSDNQARRHSRLLALALRHCALSPATEPARQVSPGVHSAGLHQRHQFTTYATCTAPFRDSSASLEAWQFQRRSAGCCTSDLACPNMTRYPRLDHANTHPLCGPLQANISHSTICSVTYRPPRASKRPSAYSWPLARGGKCELASNGTANQHTNRHFAHPVHLSTTDCPPALQATRKLHGHHAYTPPK